VAKVVIKGLMFRIPIKNPFIKPIKELVRIVAVIPKKGLPVRLNSVTPTAPPNARLDPTERSIPPPIIIKVMPIATTAKMLVWTIILKMFSNEKKLEFMRLKINPRIRIKKIRAKCKGICPCKNPTRVLVENKGLFILAIFLFIILPSNQSKVKEDHKHFS